MGDMFQLSVELYDTKDKKVVWSDRWEEKWDNLPTIKMNLSDGLLKALDTKPKVEQKVDTTNPEAYEFYLKAKHKYLKREDTDDIEIARGLLQKAIELDNNLIFAKVLLGLTYMDMGDYDEAMEIYTSTSEQAEELGDKSGIGTCLNNIGIVYHDKGDDIKALDYYSRSLAIYDELGHKRGMGAILNNIGNVYYDKGDYGKALDYLENSLAIVEELGDKLVMGINLSNIGNVHADKGDYDKAQNYNERSLAIREKIGDKQGIGINLNNIGLVHYDKGDYDTALDYYGRSLEICEELGDKLVMGINLSNIGNVHANKGDYDKAFSHLQKAVNLQKELGALELETVTLFALANKNLDKEYDKDEILKLIKKNEHKEDYLNYFLYQLLEDTSYLETAYNQIQENASAMEDKLKAKFLSYPIPKAIIEEWEKVK
jgi:tetratricopeptide (TPR) repeat protein